MSSQNKKTFFKSKLIRGFTLVELLVTLTIFSIMTGIVLVNQGQFNNTIFLNNLAHDVALTVRMAQTYGINVREFSNNKFIPYGVSFRSNSTDNKSFVLFADVPPQNGLFGGDFICPKDDVECVERYVIKSGNYIKSICAGTNELECDSNLKNFLDISFVRPNPEAQIYANNDRNMLYAYAKIVVSSQDGANIRNIIVRSTGQIYVE